MIINGVETEMNECIKNYVYLINDKSNVYLANIGSQLVNLIQDFLQAVAVNLDTVKSGVERNDQSN